MFARQVRWATVHVSDVPLSPRPPVRIPGGGWLPSRRWAQGPGPG
ncbi:hypothetical protein KCH_57880 [Kitasatospora cheerisanensis KCTC 2395]|uniref:Uncharacterized protein n=1 Tax=Kitasatospora cheerisanensis KCTC 2395 TaxID=1348663 RepID=A0A066YWY1_9ACTN|nr:hypothetical protein KCH_57880 [Kitasatospora cheerisanensis KCTC 2395]